jgi:hypothetical protein
MLRRLRTYFLTGLLVLAPLAITGYIVYRLFVWVDHLLGTTLRGGYIRPEGVPGLGFLTVLVIITVTGALANNILGRQLGALLETMLLRIPLLRGVYGTLKEIGEAIWATEQLQRVVWSGPGRGLQHRARHGRRAGTFDEARGRYWRLHPDDAESHHRSPLSIAERTVFPHVPPRRAGGQNVAGRGARVARAIVRPTPS